MPCTHSSLQRKREGEKEVEKEVEKGVSAQDLMMTLLIIESDITDLLNKATKLIIHCKRSKCTS